MHVSHSRTRLLSILLLLLLLFPAQLTLAQTEGSDGLGDRLYPQMGNGGYDVQHYSIDLNFDPALNHLTGTTRIDAIATQDLSRFNLDLHGLEVESILVDNVIASFERNGDELIITPAVALSEGDSYSALVAYSGVPQPISDPGVPFLQLGWKEWEDDFFAAAGAPSGSMNWFPSNNHPLDKATYTISVTVPAHLTAAANGVMSELIDNRDDTRTFVWQMHQQMASFLATVAVGDFVEVRDDSGAVPIRNFFPRGKAETLDHAYAATQQAMEWLTGLLGPYPYEVYGVVVIPGFPVALETQTLSIFGAEPPPVEVIVHELAHQWFGDSLALAQWGDVWLNEGFATFLMLLWPEQQTDMNGLTWHELLSTSGDYLSTLSAPGNVAIEHLFSPTVYYRGALVLHALRTEVGEDTFYDILRSYAQEYADAAVTTADFIAVAERISGEELDDFFAAWLYSDELPELP